VVRFLVLALLIACGGRAGRTVPSNVAAPGGDVTLYRDRALVRQRVELAIPPAASATVRVKIAAGVDPEDVIVVEREHVTIRELRVPVPPPQIEVEEGTVAPPPEPKEIELVVAARNAGRYAIHLAYLTDRISWEAAYTMTATPARDHATLRGALAVRNATGITLRDVSVRVVDAELGSSITRSAELLAHRYAGDEPTTAPATTARDVGRATLVDGETRLELLPTAKPHPMRSVLVYDPIGTSLDRAASSPVSDVSLGAGPASTRVTESFEIERDMQATRGLPAGPVRLFERRGDGTLAVLGEARLFDASTRVAEVDTIAIGTASNVTGHRERRDYTYDKLRARPVKTETGSYLSPGSLVEEFVITIDNDRARPVEVVVREHLYRGQNWSIADPIPGRQAVKEGPQQFSMRTIVPPRGQSRLLYVVVYTWQ
jgi:hypothetical protein